MAKDDSQVFTVDCDCGYQFEIPFGRVESDDELIQCPSCQASTGITAKQALEAIRDVNRIAYELLERDVRDEFGIEDFKRTLH